MRFYLTLICLCEVLSRYVRINSTMPVLVMNGYADPDWAALDVFGQGYNYRLSGRDWPGICQTGTRQSPINLRTFPDPKFQQVSPENSPFENLVFANSVADLEVQDLGVMNYYWIYSGSMKTTVYGLLTEEVLDSFIMHAPGEHTINGIRYPLSIQLLYADVYLGGFPKSGYLVEIMFREGSRSTFLDRLLSEEPVDLSELFPPTGLLLDYFTYVGSWNFPPVCSEEYVWVIPNYAISAAPDQIQYFTNLYANNLNFTDGNGNARAIQSINDRVITHVVES